jgi:hypothetical protein
MIDIILILLILMAGWLQSRHGIFQALVTLLSCFVAVVVAVNLYQYVATNFFGAFPTYAEGVSLAILFVAVFAMLRFGLQFLVIHDIHFGKLADPIGGGVVGVVCGLLVGGMLMLVVQTLPLGAEALGYQPYGKDLRRSSSALLGCDNLVLAVAASASDAMPGGKTFAEKNGVDPLLHSQCRRNMAGQVVREVYSETPLFRSTALYQLFDEGPTKRLLAVANKRESVRGKFSHYILRQEVSHILAPRETDADEKKIAPWWRLPATHFCILAEKKLKGKPAETRRFYPVAYIELSTKGEWTAKTNSDRNLLAIVRPDSVFAENPKYLEELTAAGKAKERGKGNWQLSAKDNWLMVDWLYCIPEGFVPQKFIYRDNVVKKVNVSDFTADVEAISRKRALRPMPASFKAKKKSKSKPKRKPAA